MTEFLEVMRQTKRMCESHRNDCTSCAIHEEDYGCPFNCLPENMDLKKMPDVERIVMDWAKEHPENEERAAENPVPDMVNHPNHYQLSDGKDCFDVMVEMFGREAVQTYCVLNAFTYLFRHVRKNGKEDVLKAEYNLAKYRELEGMEDENA